MLKHLILPLCLIVGVFTQIPRSPFGLPSEICTTKNGQIYFVNGLPSSPYFIRPFQDLFANPGVADPKDKVCRNDGHCLLSYEINVEESKARPFDNAIPACKNFGATNFITYNGKIPADSIIVPQGVQTLVRLNNKITNKFYAADAPCTTPLGKGGRPVALHLHGSNSLAPFDGWADDVVCGNETKDYIYPNQEPQMLWFHDHTIKLTADNNYAGTAGAYIISGKTKDGGCGEPYNLENIEDKIMILGDKVIDSKCQLLFDKQNYHSDDLMGDINTVNGIPYPLMPLDPKWYRFRFLNAAPSRSYKLSIKDSNLNTISHLVCQVFATDSGFKTQSVPFPMNGLLMGVSERYEVACDFSAYEGKTLYIWNDRVLDLPYFCYSHLVAKIVVSNNNVNNAPKFDPLAQPNITKLLVESVLNASQLIYAQKLANQGIFHRLMNFSFVDNQWRINGQSWDTFKIAASNLGINTWEIWKFANIGVAQHPIHMHLVDFFLLRRDNGSGINLVQPYQMYSGKDVFFSSPNNDIYVLVRFGAHKGDYMFHCHNLVHQDNLMMRAFRIQDARFVQNAPQISPRFIFNPLLIIVYGNFKYSNPLTAQLLPRKTSTAQSVTITAKKALDANYYSVFYPTTQDKKTLFGFNNPWQSKSCF